jgi:hypothetical protein
MVTKVKGSVFDEPTIPTPPDFLSGSGASSGATLAAGSTTTRTITVTGAVLGDYATASFSVDMGALSISANITAANTATVVIANNTSGGITFSAGTVYVSAQQRL